MNISHLHFQVQDLSKAMTLYGNILGFSKEVARTDDEVFYKNKSDFVIGVRVREPAEPFPRWFHLGFGAQDEEEFASVHDKIRSLGLPITQKIKDYGKYIHFYTVDFDGNNLEIYFDREVGMN